MNDTNDSLRAEILGRRMARLRTIVDAMCGGEHPVPKGATFTISADLLNELWQTCQQIAGWRFEVKDGKVTLPNGRVLEAIDSKYLVVPLQLWSERAEWHGAAEEPVVTFADFLGMAYRIDPEAMRRATQELLDSTQMVPPRT